MEEYTRKDIEDWFCDWLNREANHFAARLFDLISKADRANRERLRRAFPLFVKVYEIEMEYTRSGAIDRRSGPKPEVSKRMKKRWSTKMEANLKLKLDNSAFEGEDLGPELARVLRNLAERIEEQNRYYLTGNGSRMSCRDVNGNHIGFLLIDADDSDD